MLGGGKVIIHAESKKDKKVISCHMVTGQTCKNCLHWHRSKIFQNTGYCDFFNKAGLKYSDFCSLFKRRVEK